MNSLDLARRKLIECFVVHEIHLSLLSGTSSLISFSFILQQNDFNRGLKRQVAYLLMKERMCQIKRENCFASLLRVIHKKYNGQLCGRQHLIFKTECILGRQKKTPFKRWK